MLKFLPLLWSNLRRKPVRTGLTFASILVAFLLFGLLKTLESALTLGVDLAGADRLVTMHKVSLIQPLPRSYLARIRAVDGVRSATSNNWFGGIYQDDRNQLAAMSADPESFLEVYEEYAMPPEQRAAWFADRTSMIVGKNLAERFGWSVGDTVPVRSSFYAKTDGSNVWDFKVAAIYDAANGDNSSLYFHYDYLNESTSVQRDMVGWVILRIDDPARMADIAREIDAMFANSPAETKTSTERAFLQGFANAMGDIGAIVAAVATAVFFTMLLVTGNTMAQSVRERTNEIAVLKTLGYSSRGVSLLVLAEAFVITAAGGAAGLALAALAADSMSAALAQFFPVIGIPFSAYLLGAALIVVLSMLAGLLPSMQALNLRITDALRKA
jgi:putative ABC transport system permease protein